MPVEFVVPVRAQHPLGDQQTLLGRQRARAGAGAARRARAAKRCGASSPRRVSPARRSTPRVAARECPGNRASTTLLLPTLDAWQSRRAARALRAPDIRRKRADAGSTPSTNGASSSARRSPSRSSPRSSDGDVAGDDRRIDARAGRTRPRVHANRNAELTFRPRSTAAQLRADITLEIECVSVFRRDL